MATLNGGDERRFPCQQCDKAFMLQLHLKQHIDSVHLKLRPHKCPHCDYSAAQSGTLNRHLQTHAKQQQMLVDPRRKSFEDAEAVSPTAFNPAPVSAPPPPQSPNSKSVISPAGDYKVRLFCNIQGVLIDCFRDTL